MIRFEHVTKKYKESTVIKDISFEVPKGQLVSLIGSSGCGKTTTLKMINRLVRPTSGSIYVDGKDIAKQDVIKLRRNMGYVIQQTGLFPHMTVRQNIELIPKVDKRSKEDIARRTLELMDLVGLDPHQYLDRYPTQLSGGQQQRVGVARAFACDPDVILMDEPFSALDPINRASLQDELVALQDTLKKTIVFVTHDMDEAIKISDRIVIMEHGNIAQYDTPENVLRSPANDAIADFVGQNRIWSSPEYIHARDIMIPDPIRGGKTFTLFQCMKRMSSNRVDSLMIVDLKTNKLCGVVKAEQIRTCTDHSAMAESIMNPVTNHVGPDDTIIDILNIMNERNITSFPVLDEQDVLLGLITKSSLVTILSQQFMDNGEGQAE